MDFIKNKLKSQYITTFIIILVLLYSATIENNIGNYKKSQYMFLRLFEKIFNHHFFRMIYLLSVFYFLNKNLELGFGLAVAFIMINIALTKNMVKNNLKQFENFIELEHFSENYYIKNKKSKI